MQITFILLAVIRGLKCNCSCQPGRRVKKINDRATGVIPTSFQECLVKNDILVFFYLFLMHSCLLTDLFLWFTDVEDYSKIDQHF